MNIYFQLMHNSQITEFKFGNMTICSQNFAHDMLTELNNFLHESTGQKWQIQIEKTHDLERNTHSQLQDSLRNSPEFQELVRYFAGINDIKIEVA